MHKKSIYPYQIEPGLVVLAPEAEKLKPLASEEVMAIIEGVNLLNRRSKIEQDPFEVLQRLGYYENKEGDWVSVRATIVLDTTV